MAFKDGDIVELKVDGPSHLIVEGLRTDGLVMCAWFDNNHELRRDVFHPRVLIPDENEDE